MSKLTLSERYHKVNITDGLLDQWANSKTNILIMGERGTGKTERILKCFERNFKNYVVFSGATLDPWTDLIGIPRVSGEEGGDQFINYVRPQEINENIEAFFIDEYNRSKPAVKNAIMELCQFGSINGKKFPNLKVVWAAINPPPLEDDDEDEFYSVDHIDPAQLDRFKVIIKVPSEPCIKFFKDRFGDDKGEALVSWWTNLPATAQKYISPRRLQYVGDAFGQGLDIKYFLPINCQVDSLVRKLSLDEKDLALYDFKKNPSKASLKKLINGDDSIWNNYRKDILSSQDNMPYIAGSIPSECFAVEIRNEEFLKYQSALYITGDKNVKQELDKIIDAGGNDDLGKKLSTLDLIYSEEPWVVFDFSLGKDKYSFCKRSVSSFKSYVLDGREYLEEFCEKGKINLTVRQANSFPRQTLNDLVYGYWDFNCEQDKMLVSSLIKNFIDLGYIGNVMHKNLATIYNTMAITSRENTEIMGNLISIYRHIESLKNKAVENTFIAPSKLEFMKIKLSDRYLGDWKKIKKHEA